MPGSPSQTTPLTLIRMTYVKDQGWKHDDANTVAVPINPSDLTFSTSLPTASAHSATASTAQSPAGQVTRSLSLSLLLDAYEDFYKQPDEANGIYEKYVKRLEALTSRDASGIAPVVLLTWNNKRFLKVGQEQEKAKFVDSKDNAASSFFATVASFSVKYSLFHSDGTPLRGTVTMSLTEANMADPGQAKGR